MYRRDINRLWAFNRNQAGNLSYSFKFRHMSTESISTDMVSFQIMTSDSDYSCTNSSNKDREHSSLPSADCPEADVATDIRY